MPVNRTLVPGGFAWESDLTMSANGETRYIRELRSIVERVQRGAIVLDNRNNPITKADLPELQRMLQKALKR